MPQDLVAAVRLRGVERVGAMPDVLGAVEHPKSQAAEEVPGAEVTCYWANLKASLPLKVLIDVL